MSSRIEPSLKVLSVDSVVLYDDGLKSWSWSMISPPIPAFLPAFPLYFGDTQVNPPSIPPPLLYVGPLAPKRISLLGPSYNCANSCGPYTGDCCSLPKASTGNALLGENTLDGSELVDPT